MLDNCSTIVHEAASQPEAAEVGAEDFASALEYREGLPPPFLLESGGLAERPWAVTGTLGSSAKEAWT